MVEKQLAPSQAYLKLLSTSVPFQTSKLGVYGVGILNTSSDNGVCSGTCFDHPGNFPSFSLCPLRHVCRGVIMQEDAQLTACRKSLGSLMLVAQWDRAPPKVPWTRYSGGFSRHFSLASRTTS